MFEIHRVFLHISSIRTHQSRVNMKRQLQELIRTCSQEMRNTGLHFKKHSHAPVYREYSLGREIASTIYSLIQQTRYFCRQHSLHALHQKLCIWMLIPASLVSRPIASDTTITLPYLINIAVSEECVHRGVLQGLMLTTAPNYIASFLNFNIGFFAIPLLFFRILLQAIIFSAAHTQNQFTGDLNRFISAIIYGVMYEITGSIFPSTFAHLAWNMKNNNPMAVIEQTFPLDELSPLDPRSFQVENKNYFQNVKADFLKLLLCLLLRFAVSNASKGNYKDLFSPMMLVFYVVVAVCIYAVKKDNRERVFVLGSVSTLKNLVC